MKSASAASRTAGMLWAFLMGALLPCIGNAEDAPAVQGVRHVSVELYVRQSESSSVNAIAAAQKVLEARPGISFQIHDLDGADAEQHSQRLAQIAGHFKIDATQLPLLYGCNTVVQGFTNAEAYATSIRDMLRIDVYAREGCPHCQQGRAFISRLLTNYPGFELRIREIVRDPQAREEMNRLVQKYRQAATSVPVFHFCNQLIVGFDNASTTGKRIEAVLQYWTFPAPKPRAVSARWPRTSWPVLAVVTPARLLSRHWSVVGLVDTGENTGDAPPPPPLPPPPLPAQGSANVVSDHSPLPGQSASLPDQDAIDLPWVGTLRLADVGLPMFTLAVGLVDGFNPCAMWVLLFLLSILVNLRSRARILLVAGTFVFISGAAYYAFMAAWLNIFMLIGLLRPVQITLGILALAVGSIHIKDFFAFKKGVSLSIPEAAKPGIYARVERIVRAENMTGALIGATVLAVLVNIIELLCTAGLPAMYTSILTLQQLPPWKNYAYLLLYNVGYMFDDSVMVLLVAITMGKRKMQERQGRWLKLVSGVAVAALGLIMLLRPEWLI